VTFRGRTIGIHNCNLTVFRCQHCSTHSPLRVTTSILRSFFETFRVLGLHAVLKLRPPFAKIRCRIHRPSTTEMTLRIHSSYLGLTPRPPRAAVSGRDDLAGRKGMSVFVFRLASRPSTTISTPSHTPNAAGMQALDSKKGEGEKNKERKPVGGFSFSDYVLACKYEWMDEWRVCG
jgi:hypothetical protein